MKGPEAGVGFTEEQQGGQRSSRHLDHMVTQTTLKDFGANF